MTVMVLLSAGFGLGVALLAVWAVPPRPALGPQLARITAPPTTQPTVDHIRGDGSSNRSWRSSNQPASRPALSGAI
jgi:hypothetical protein